MTQRQGIGTVYAVAGQERPAQPTTMDSDSIG